MTDTNPSIRRRLFVVTILTGSFLLFLVQPMVARMALPRLGGAPNVWNSAMLVYQALLLAGYGYAHWLSKMPLQQQAKIHLGLLLAAALTLPITLADLPPPAPGGEVWWVPLLFFASVGPVFLLVSAQAPLMQRWYSADPAAGEPWALYAASNLGSFTGLIAYPLLAEPLLRLHQQSLGWSAGYVLLIVLIALAARARWQFAPSAVQTADSISAAPVPARRIIHWLALSAIPSGLMLSTTTHLTTDIFAMPLLWVIPLGLYLLSFVAAFSDRRGAARVISLMAPVLMLMAGGAAMSSRNVATMMPVFESVVLLFVIAVSLHARMYELRPPASQLTLFYFVMSAGGALGGLFTALIAPVLFDWVWEHPLLIAAAAVLLPLPRAFDWRRLPGLEPLLARVGLTVLLILAVYLAVALAGADPQGDGSMPMLLAAGLIVIGVAVIPWRWAWLAVLAALMLAQGGIDTIVTSWHQARSRSYFGIYTVREYGAPGQRVRTLAHGTTLHGEQSIDPGRSREPMTYYGPASGAGITLAAVPALYGTHARIGIVGLGTGTLACYHQAGQDWRFFEIDPAVLHFSRNGTFTFVRDCAPAAKVTIGDARINLAQLPGASFDVLAVDAFSSDAIPLHLLTDEALGIYFKALSPRGVLLVHISNRYIELEPVLAALARKHHVALAKRDDNPADQTYLTASTWVALSRDPAVIAALGKARADAPWGELLPAAPQVWSDDHASILPYIRWHHLLKRP
jgi:hypothetical protein